MHKLKVCATMWQIRLTYSVKQNALVVIQLEHFILFP